jgi:hypothetical protein
MHFRSFQRPLAALAVAATVAIFGCQATPWQQGLAKGPDAAAPLDPKATVRVREVPWERLEQTLSSLRADVAASNIHPDEWSVEKRHGHKLRLLQGLQISEPAESAKVLGRSEFRTSDRVTIPSDDLQRLATSLGADTVVWSSRPLGKSDRVVQEPVTWFSDGTRYWDHPNEHRGAFSETRTGWVPVRIQVDEFGYVGFFIRTRD